MKSQVIFSLVGLSMSLTGYAQFSPFFVIYKVADDSMASREQLLQLGKIIEASIDPKTEAMADYTQLNQALAQMNLPQVDLNSKTLEVKYPHKNGFSGPILAGASISDGKTQFCLPCSVDGKLELGISPIKKSMWDSFFGK